MSTRATTTTTTTTSIQTPTTSLMPRRGTKQAQAKPKDSLSQQPQIRIPIDFLVSRHWVIGKVIKQLAEIRRQSGPCYTRWFEDKDASIPDEVCGYFLVVSRDKKALEIASELISCEIERLLDQQAARRNHQQQRQNVRDRNAPRSNAPRSNAPRRSQQERRGRGARGQRPEPRVPNVHAGHMNRLFSRAIKKSPPKMEDFPSLPVRAKSSNESQTTPSYENDGNDEKVHEQQKTEQTTSLSPSPSHASEPVAEVPDAWSEEGDDIIAEC